MKKTKKIEVLLTEENFNKIRKRARENGMSDSEFLGFTGLNSKINCTVGMPNSLISELNILESFKNRNVLTEDQLKIAVKKTLTKN